jgi:hypothetical protein
MQPVPVSVLFPLPIASGRAPRWWPAPIAASASGSRRFLPACAGRCARPKAAPRPGRRPRPLRPRRSSSIPGCPISIWPSFSRTSAGSFPQVDLVTAGGSVAQESPRGPYRQELLYALRRSQDTDTAAGMRRPRSRRPSRRSIQPASQSMAGPRASRCSLPPAFPPLPFPSRGTSSASSDADAGSQ